MAISGADTSAQIAENIGALDAPIAPEDLAMLSQVSSGLDLLLD
jgi:aryl-alcohol dehydrogenase-like predicted oxidoreductase